MIEKLASGIVAWQIKRQILKPEDKELYCYAFELLINQAFNILIAIVIAIVFDSAAFVFIFLLCYIPLRSFAGGYHAKTNGGCSLVSAVILCFVCWLTPRFPSSWILVTAAVAAVVSGLAVFCLAPVEDSNKPLDAKEGRRYRVRSRILWIAESCLWILCYSYKFPRAVLVIALSHLILSVMLAAGSVKNESIRGVSD